MQNFCFKLIPFCIGFAALFKFLREAEEEEKTRHYICVCEERVYESIDKYYYYLECSNILLNANSYIWNMHME